MTIEQGSPEWLQLRAGKVTASCFKDVLAKIAKGEASDRRKYRIQIASERLTGLPTPSGFESAAMRWGKEQEFAARAAYEAHTGNIVDQVAFVDHPTLLVGCSPDGLIGNDGGVEIKCPESHTHIEWMLDGGLPSKHVAQVQGSMWVTDRSWWDFASYDPRMPKHLRLHVVRVKRDPEYILELEREVIKFLGEVNDMIKWLSLPEEA